ncbi:hypothetical protein M8C21_007359 [Ambrosia artemisiifolia]|uniref:Uncharacterized protein n=1 Tax=Ambrosia artemisiifolia TaxID=4212 RepID=A0AAD5GDZ5_AMBAR|nr:hypothetical protein M8C21_007359 [Ambrosia artemisiifolia]
MLILTSVGSGLQQAQPQDDDDDEHGKSQMANCCYRTTVKLKLIADSVL